jgi:hypothetical protein
MSREIEQEIKVVDRRKNLTGIFHDGFKVEFVGPVLVARKRWGVGVDKIYYFSTLEDLKKEFIDDPSLITFDLFRDETPPEDFSETSDDEYREIRLCGSKINDAREAIAQWDGLNPLFIRGSNCDCDEWGYYECTLSKKTWRMVVRYE